MDIHHWHIFSREELLGIVERDPVAVVDLAMALQKRVLELEELVAQQQAVIGQLTARIERLEARLQQDSHNSHQPPSSDGYVKPAPKSLREKSSRPSGGQPGHPGHTLKAVARPDHRIPHPLKRCPRGHPLMDCPVIRQEKRQVFDLPVLGLEVVEHHAEVKVCPTCEESVTAAFPAGVEAPVQYGPRFLTLLAYWRDAQLLPLERIRQMAFDLFSQWVSEATIQQAVVTTAEALVPFEQDLKTSIQQASQLNADETGLRINGKGQWLHVLATPTLTWYGVHPKRGCAAMEDFDLLPNFRGRLVHDEFGPYWTYGREHVLCNAHHERELVFAAEQEHQPWAACLKTLLERANQKRQDQGSLTTRQAHHYVERYRDLLNDASPPPGTKAHSLHRRLLKFEGPTLAFLKDPTIPFTNNQAEQDLRMMKVQQKISGPFRTFEGARLFACVRSYIATLRKQHKSVWDGLAEALRGRPFLPTAA
jgi:transposase